MGRGLLFFLVREEKEAQTQTFGSGYLSGGMEVFRVKGWGPKSSVLPSKPRETNFFFCRISRDFTGIPEGHPNSLIKQTLFGIVQKVFSEKASAIARMRQKCVRNASKMLQDGFFFLLGKEERSKMRQKCVKIASEMRQKCAEHLWGRTPFGRYRIVLNPCYLEMGQIRFRRARFKHRAQ